MASRVLPIGLLAGLAVVVGAGGLVLAAPGPRATGPTGVVVVDVGTGTRTTIADAGQAIWLPGSSSILVWDDHRARTYTRAGRPVQTVRLRRPAEDSLTVAGDRLAYVSLRPNGFAISTGALVISRLDGHDRRRPMPDATGRIVASPDGRQLLVARRFGDDREGSETERSFTRNYRIALPGGPPRRDGSSTPIVAWLPGDRLLGLRETRQRSDVVLVEHGRRTRTVVRDQRTAHLAVSPDGRRLAIAGPIEGDVRYHLSVVAIRRGAARRITSDTYDGVAWSPDSARLVATTEDGRLVVMDRDGTHRRTLATFEGRTTRNVSWSPDGRSVALTLERLVHGD